MWCSDYLSSWILSRVSSSLDRLLPKALLTATIALSTLPANAPAVMAIASEAHHPSISSKFVKSINLISQLPTTATLIYVDPQASNQNTNQSTSQNTVADGSPSRPYTSITAAIASRPLAGTVIQLAKGTYSADSGEIFPIKLPAGIILRGEPTQRGASTIISGSGKYISPSFASQNIALLAGNNVRIEGVTVTNPATRGTAVWVESSKGVAIANNTLSNSNREGLFLTGNAEVSVTDNVFKNNGANGLSAVGSSSGEIRNNFFEETGFGLAIGQRSRVLVSNNNIIKNTDGVVISNLAAPILRNNLIADNQRNGIVILKDRVGYPTPDLGTTINLGQNVFRNNREKDLNNNSGVEQVAVGNELDPQKIAGKISFTGMTPTPAATLPSVPSLPPSRPAIASPPRIEEVVIDRDPVPITPPPIPKLPTSAFIPTEPTSNAPAPATNIPEPVAPVTIPIVRDETTPNAPINNANNGVNNNPSNNPNINPPVPYNPAIAALIPANTPQIRIDQAPYLVVIPSADVAVLNRVQSAVPSAKIIPSRFGNIIMVDRYPDRDRAEVLRAIIKSGVGLDARVIHQNNL